MNKSIWMYKRQVMNSHLLVREVEEEAEAGPGKEEGEEKEQYD